MAGTSPAMTWRGRCAITDSHFKEAQHIASKIQSSAAPVLARRGERRAFPSLASRGESSLTKYEGSGAPKGADNFDTPCGARPITLGVHLAALHFGVFL